MSPSSCRNCSKVILNWRRWVQNQYLNFRISSAYWLVTWEYSSPSPFSSLFLTSSSVASLSCRFLRSPNECNSEVDRRSMERVHPLAGFGQPLSNCNSHYCLKVISWSIVIENVAKIVSVVVFIARGYLIIWGRVVVFPNRNKLIPNICSLSLSGSNIFLLGQTGFWAISMHTTVQAANIMVQVDMASTGAMAWLATKLTVLNSSSLTASYINSVFFKFLI